MTTTRTDTEPKLLGIYLNDHLAGATAGLELAKRLAGALHDTPAATELKRLADDITEERQSLIAMTRKLGFPVRRYKIYGAWLGEKAGRAKPNGRLIRRSPLSDVVELEAMRLGVIGKSAAWQTLRTLADRDQRLDKAELDRLLDQAKAQERTLEQLRVRAVEEIIGAR
jgi:hypothetical protein